MNHNKTVFPKAVFRFDSVIFIFNGQEMKLPNGSKMIAEFQGSASMLWRYLSRKKAFPIILTNPEKTIPKLHIKKVRLLRIGKSYRKGALPSYILYVEPVYDEGSLILDTRTNSAQPKK